MKRTIHISLFCLMLVRISYSNDPFLIKECSAGAPTYFEYSKADDFIQVGKTVFFAYDNKINERELWKTDGTPEGTVLVKDINPGPASSYANSLISFNGLLFFAAFDGSTGGELWQSDGTTAGTHLVKDIAPGSGNSGLSYLFPWKGALYFFADMNKNTYGLWRTDGSANGTFCVAEFEVQKEWKKGKAYQIFSEMKSITRSDVIKEWGKPGKSVLMGSNLYYSKGKSLWKIDGATMQATIVAYTDSERPEFILSELTVLGSRLLFAAGDQNGKELWQSDGTPGGTFLLKDIREGKESSAPRHLIQYKRSVFFSADDGIHGRELWITDGTSKGTHMCKDINPGPGSSEPEFFAAGNDALYFITLISADKNTFEKTFWKTDGTDEGTRPIYHYQTNWHDYVYFNMLWATPNGVFFMAPADRNACMYRYNPDSDSVNCFHQESEEVARSINAAPAFNGLVFSTYARLKGRMLGFSDGTEAGTRMFALSPNAYPGCYMSNFISFKDNLYFDGNFYDNGTKISGMWKSNGTRKGTRQVYDLSPRFLGTVGNTLYFTAIKPDIGYELWSSDGTHDGTKLIHDINPGMAGSNPSNLMEIPPWIFFMAADGAYGRQLWRIDPATHIIARVTKVFDEKNYGMLRDFFVWGKKLYFLAKDSSGALALWKTDGSEEGTAPIVSLSSIETAKTPDVQRKLSSDFFFFSTRSSWGKEYLWRSDGTAEGTLPVRNSHDGLVETLPLFWVENRGILYLSAYESDTGAELWRSDGTARGTYRIKDINPGIGGSDLFLKAICGNIIFFSATDGIHGQELWKTDGTEVGTVMVKDIRQGPSGSMMNRSSKTAICAGKRLFFSASDGNLGLELWESNGTSLGTHLVKDFVPGASSSNPDNFTLAGNIIYFTITDPVHGMSLWGLK